MAQRAIVVIHGVGSYTKGQTLNEFVEPFVRFLNRFIRKGNPHAIHEEVYLNPPDGPAHAKIAFQHQQETETWVIKEAWWAERFIPHGGDEVLAWGWRLLLMQGLNIVYGLLRWIKPLDYAGRLIQRLTFLRRVPLLGKLLLLHTEPYPASASFPYQDPHPDAPDLKSRTGGLFRHLYDVGVGVILLLFFLVSYLVVMALASFFWIVAHLPSWLLVSEPAAKLAETLVGFLVSNPGDQYTILYDYMARHSTAQTVIDTLRPLLDSTHPDFQRYETVTIIAHSGGAIVSYVALSDEVVKGWDFGALTAPNHTKVTWFTLGSGLNFAFRDRRDDPFWERRLDPRIRWVDIWARYDPVSHGQAPDGLPEHIMDDPGIRSAMRHAGARFTNLRVVNRDNPFSDHGGYWRNYEEVVGRFVWEIMGQPSATTPLGDAIDTVVQEIPNHRKGVARIVSVRATVAAIVLGLAKPAGMASALGSTLLAALPTPPDWIAPLGVVASKLTGTSVGADAVIGLCVLGVGGYLAYRIATLWARGFLERGDDWA